MLTKEFRQARALWCSPYSTSRCIIVYVKQKTEHVLQLEEVNIVPLKPLCMQQALCLPFCLVYKHPPLIKFMFSVLVFA